MVEPCVDEKGKGQIGKLFCFWISFRTELDWYFSDVRGLLSLSTFTNLTRGEKDHSHRAGERARRKVEPNARDRVTDVTGLTSDSEDHGQPLLAHDGRCFSQDTLRCPTPPVAC
jgi:hypothetical protein